MDPANGPTAAERQEKRCEGILRFDLPNGIEAADDHSISPQREILSYIRVLMDDRSAICQSRPKPRHGTRR